MEYKNETSSLHSFTCKSVPNIRKRMAQTINPNYVSFPSICKFIKFSQKNINHYNNAFNLATNVMLKYAKIGLKQHIFLLQSKCSLSVMNNTITNS